MILFFDTFIINSQSMADRGFNHDRFSKKRSKLSKILRGKNNNYKYQEKIDIVKYTLISYSKIIWDEIIIRFECEDNSQTKDFFCFCKNLFPDAFIENARSNSAKKYINALKIIKNQNNPWIFFSPNNDQVNLVSNNEYIPVIKDAELAEKKFPGYNVSILYSHYPEAINSYSINKSLWGYYGRNFQKKIYETKNTFFVLNSRLMCDSIKIFRLNFLLNLFENQDEKKKIIRPEDTNNYLSNKIKEIQIVPKIELCRHYDGYPLSFIDPPPLFIPPGFFQSKIKIKYMFDEYDKDFVNINPTGKYIFFNKGNCDLTIFLDDIPFFWKDRINNIISNQRNHMISLSKNELVYYKNLVNPWNKIPLFINLILSLMRLLKLTRFANKICDLFTVNLKY